MSKQDQRFAALRGESTELNNGIPQASRLTQADEARTGPVTDEILARLGHVCLWRIVVEPYIPPKRGLIERPDQVEDAERILSKVGKVLMVGAFAYKSKTSSGLDLADEPNKATVGGYVLHEMYAGTEVHLTTGQILRIITESEVLMTGFDPSIIRAYS